MTLAGQSLLRHIQNKDLLAVGNLVSNGTINLDERDEVSQRLGKGFNTLRPRQNGCYFADDICKCLFLNENVWIAVKISLFLGFVLYPWISENLNSAYSIHIPKVQINNIPALVQIMAWRWPGDKLLSELMMVSLLTQLWFTRPQWVNSLAPGRCGSTFISVISEHRSSSWALLVKLLSGECHRTPVMIS